ncbi:MAG: hypothetical protein II894_09655 [Bacteroidales bacterium]|nr:hypothetical protein [Bacteroidales bacterium]
MKRLILVILFVSLVCAAAFGQTRQNAAPYNNAIGATVGFVNAVSFKNFPTNNFAIQLDLGYRFLWDYGYNHVPTIISFNPNFMYERAAKNGFYWFIGAGFNIGGTLAYGRHYDYEPGPHSLTWYDYYYHSNFVFGVNVIGGAEYKFERIPLALQVDARPGVFLFANHKYHDPYFLFDYNFLNISARFTF